MATVGGQTPSDQLVNHAVRYLYAHEQDCGDQFADPLWLPAVDRCDQSCDPLRTICLEHTGEHKIQVCRPLPQSCVEGLLRQFSSVDDAPANVDRDESAQQHSFSTMNNHEQISRLVEEKMVQQATPNRTTDTRLAAVVMKVSSNDDLPPPPPPPPLKLDLAASGTPLYSNMPTKSDLYFQQLAPFEATIDDEEALATKEQFGSVRYRPRSRFITAPEPLARLKGPPKAVIFKPTVIKKQRRPPPPPESARDFLKFKGQSRLRAGRKGKGGGVSPKDRFRQATVSPTYRSPVNDNEVRLQQSNRRPSANGGGGNSNVQAHGQVNRPASAKSTRVRPQNILPDTNWESGEEITHLMHSLMEENRQNRQGVVGLPFPRIDRFLA